MIVDGRVWGNLQRVRPVGSVRQAYGNQMEVGLTVCCASPEIMVKLMSVRF